MAVDEQNQIVEPVQRRHNTSLAGIISTLQFVLIALVLAFIFRAFVMEAYRIPTGSMAKTLRGSHYHLRCTRCGYKYDFGDDYGQSAQLRCPNCTFFASPAVPVSNGDRIFVYKSIYYFSTPKRWDVVVFKNPLNPVENYIKRMIAGPGETVEIIDGDVYINGQIARKPPRVQNDLWMPIYNNDYQPHKKVKPVTGKKTSNQAWQQPFRNQADSKWNLICIFRCLLG